MCPLASACLAQPTVASIATSVKYHYHYATVASYIFQIPFLLQFPVKGNIQSRGKF